MEEGSDSVSEISVCNPLDMNSTDFNADIYMNKLLKESRLSELMDTEQMLFKQIQTLDSEMQTLIYENYNKFISATDTVKKMSSHFDKMEHELSLLSQNMQLITRKSNEIAVNLSGKRDELTRMSSTHFLLNKIQFILELPAKMQSQLGLGRLTEAVDDYIEAKYALDLYSHFPSIRNIQVECTEMLDLIKARLYDQLANEEATTAETHQSIEYLIKLNENATKLCDKYFEMCEKKLELVLSSMQSSVEIDESNIPSMDILEFIDNVCNSYLGSLNQCIIFFTEVFLQNNNKTSSKTNNKTSSEDQVEGRLKLFVDQRMEDLFEIILRRIRRERKAPHNIIMFVRALDRFYKRVQKLNKIYAFTDFTERGLAIVVESTQDQCAHLLGSLKAKLTEELATLRADILNDMSHKGSGVSRKVATSISNLTTSNTSATSTSSSLHDSQPNSLSEALIAFETTICENLKSTLSALTPFMDAELTFLKRSFKEHFVGRCVFAGLLQQYATFILATALEYESSERYSTAHIPPQLLLLLSKLCLDMANHIVGYLFQFTEEMFGRPSTSSVKSSQMISTLTKDARDYAQRLLNVYVWIEGQAISHMIRKSVETRDWLSGVEPRSVRSVVKRVIEDVTLIDFQVGQLYEEGVRVERSSDSSRTFSSFNYSGSRQQKQSAHKSATSKSSWSYSANSFDNHIISNIHKLFNDKIEIFGRVDFSKLSIVTGVIKIGLKTLIECIRLCTFSRYGFQQMQVDAYYLQTHLWRFTSDEKIVANLIEDVIASTKKRCLDATGMERSVIENICENA